MPTMREIIRMAKEIGAVGFFPTSALKDTESLRRTMNFVYDVGLDFVSKISSNIWKVENNNQNEKDKNCEIM